MDEEEATVLSILLTSLTLAVGYLVKEYAEKPQETIEHLIHIGEVLLVVGAIVLVFTLWYKVLMKVVPRFKNHWNEWRA